MFFRLPFSPRLSAFPTLRVLIDCGQNTADGANNKSAIRIFRIVEAGGNST